MMMKGSGGRYSRRGGPADRGRRWLVRARLLGAALAIGAAFAIVGLAGVTGPPAAAQPVYELPKASGGSGANGAPGGGGSHNNHSATVTPSSFSAPAAPAPYTPPAYVPPPPTYSPAPPADIPPPPAYVPPPPVNVPPPPVNVPPPPVNVPPPPVNVPPPPVNVPPPPAHTGGTAPAALSLDSSTIPQGGDLTATGQGCTPGAPVALSIGDVEVGTAEADQNGGFRTALTTDSMEIGPHQVTAECGETLAAPLDVVLVSSVGTSTSTVTVIVFFLLVGVWAYAHRLGSHLSARRDHRAG